MNTLNIRGLTINMTNAGLAAGTTSTYTTTATTAHVVNGKFGTTLTAQTNTATPTTDATTGAGFVALTDNQASVFVFGVTAAGAIAVSQGSIEATQVGVTTTAGDFIVTPQFPSLPNDFCPIGYVLVRTAPSAATWTFGTSHFDATGTTEAWANVCTVPDRPATS